MLQGKIKATSSFLCEKEKRQEIEQDGKREKEQGFAFTRTRGKLFLLPEHKNNLSVCLSICLTVSL